MNIRQLFDCTCWRSKPLGPCELDGGCSSGEDGVDDQVIRADLNDSGGVADPGIFDLVLKGQLPIRFEHSQLPLELLVILLCRFVFCLGMLLLVFPDLGIKGRENVEQPLGNHCVLELFEPQVELFAAKHPDLYCLGRS